jgi:hypothetical protein
MPKFPDDYICRTCNGLGGLPGTDCAACGNHGIHYSHPHRQHPERDYRGIVTAEWCEAQTERRRKEVLRWASRSGYSDALCKTETRSQ